MRDIQLPSKYWKKADEPTIDASLRTSSSKNDSSLGTKTYMNISKFGKIYPLLIIMIITRPSKRIRQIVHEMRTIRTSEPWNLSWK